ncbi:hypothetical protein VM1G_04648 [Cytospora mali]|uniref:Fork-head domain-containing protein n=1 Tax=Cytospora mali TaxID=578113 RepID=A0A194VX18_CYTMA|nr:hypothetical protein VM1G_04648 [Valsa mali]
MFPSTMDPSGKPADLTLPPFRPGLNLATATTLPPLRDVISFLHEVVKKAPVSSDTKGVEMKDVEVEGCVKESASSSEGLLPVAVAPTKKRTPLPNSRPSGALPVEFKGASSKYPSNDRKRPRAGSDEDDGTDLDIRASKRSRQGQSTFTNNVDWNLDENKSTKPAVSYVQMAKDAILSTPEKVLSLEDILTFITANYAYYRLLQDQAAWKSSIYGALRASKAFEKVGKSTVSAQWWRVKAEYHAMQKPARWARLYTLSNPPF